MSCLPCSGFHPRLCWSNLFHQPNSLWIPVANQAIHEIYLFVHLRVPHVFRFLWFRAAGLPAALHSHFHFFLVLDFQCVCFRQIRNPVMKMMMKWVWALQRNSQMYQGPRMAHSLIYCNQFSCPFWWCGFWPLVQWLVCPWSSQSFQREEMQEFLQEA